MNKKYAGLLDEEMGWFAKNDRCDSGKRSNIELKLSSSVFLRDMQVAGNKKKWP